MDILVTIGLKSMLSCLQGARLTLILQIICFRTSAAPIDSLAYFFFSQFGFAAGIVLYACVILNPVASIPVNMCPVPVKSINEEIIFQAL